MILLDKDTCLTLCNTIISKNKMDIIHATRYDTSRRHFSVDWDSLCKRHPSKYARCVLPKPAGIWFSIGNAWTRWRTKNMQKLPRLYPHPVNFDRADLICIETLSDLAKFEKRFGVASPEKILHVFPFLIDWTRVVNAYPNKIGVLLLAGTLVDQMSFKHAMRSFWMRLWDVDSIVVFGGGGKC